jgi:hypothetical protein
MIELIVTIHVYVEGEGLFQTKEEPLTLQTLAPVSNGDSKEFGRWESRSRYLGHDYTNKYYVKNNPYFPDNPFGFFLDSQGDEDEPFLILRGFEPMSMKPGDSGEGRIMRTSATEVKYVEVKWRRDK